jgi:4-nitrophenyl phosphatase
MGYRGAIVDLDGTVYRGGTLVPGALDGVATLRDRGIDPLFVTNNPTRSPSAYADRLESLGLDVDPDRILSAGSITATYLAEQYPERPTYVIGSPGLREMLDEAGVVRTDDPDAAEVLVTSHDYEFDYDDLTAGLWALEDATAFVGTDPDLTYPGGDGRDRPGSGAITGAVATVARREPDHVLGKPAPETLAVVRERLDCPLEECLIVGDRLDTDVALGERGGMTTVLVLSGTTTRADLGADVAPLPGSSADLEPDRVIDRFGAIGSVVDDHT